MRRLGVWLVQVKTPVLLSRHRNLAVHAAVKLC